MCVYIYIQMGSCIFLSIYRSIYNPYRQAIASPARRRNGHLKVI